MSEQPDKAPITLLPGGQARSMHFDGPTKTITLYHDSEIRGGWTVPEDWTVIVGPRPHLESESFMESYEDPIADLTAALEESTRTAEAIRKTNVEIRAELERQNERAERLGKTQDDYLAEWIREIVKGDE